MFEFFEGIIGDLKLKLISNFSEKVADYITECIKNIKKEKEETTEDEKLASSGDSSKLASSGDFSQLASSGDSSQLASSGDFSQLASSGDSSQLASSGDYSQLASSGYYSKLASSGYSSQLASSGDFSQLASSGYSSQLASSGDSSKLASSGDFSKLASSGDSSQLAVTGKDSIAFSNGYKSTIKAKKGTWIALAEYGKNNKDRTIPIYAKIAQIGNKEYKDNKNKILKSNTEYILWNKEFCEVIRVDEIESIIISEKKRDNIRIIKAVDIDDIYQREEAKIMYITIDGKYSAHGYTLREAVDDLTYKKLNNTNSKEIVSEIKKTGKVTRSQYRALTGACSFGTNKFCKEHNIQDLEEIELEELRKILINDYGAKRFWNLIDGIEE